MDASAETNKKLPEIVNNIKNEPPNEFLLLLRTFDPEKRLLGDVAVKQESENHNSGDENGFKCGICDKVFGDSYGLKSHKKSHDKRKCDICLKEVAPKSFEKHLKSHEGEKERKFQCKVCAQKFLTKFKLSRHSKLHQRSLECDFCGHVSYNKALMTHHLALHVQAGK